MEFIKLKQIDKGWSSFIYLVKEKTTNKIYILKETREKSNRKELAKREGSMLSLANSVGIGPKIKKIDYENNGVIMEYIKGKEISKFIFEDFEKITKYQLYELIKDLYRQLYKLDKINLSHNQLLGGKNILITKKRKNYFPIIIDFEKSNLKEKTKNIGQIDSFLFYNPNSEIAKKIREKLEIKL
ncbi:MAG: hypothetical protein PHQ98_02385 [Candidatus ainarchaeum sp.]|nr:hypothetical protein [Candidatus ainarchaeum sp.]